MHMTTAPESPDVAFEDVRGAFDRLREQRFRLSSARRLVLEALFSAEEPASADALAERLSRGGLPADLASVYRNLETLERAGIVRHVHFGHGAGLYTLAGGRERGYLHCERCGRIDTIEPAQLNRIRDAIRRHIGYHARFTHFPIVGLCATCAATPSSAEARGSARHSLPRASAGHDSGRAVQVKGLGSWFQ